MIPCHIIYVDVVNAELEMPGDAEVIGVQWQTSGGLMHQQHPCGLWLLIRGRDET